MARDLLDFIPQSHVEGGRALLGLSSATPLEPDIPQIPLLRDPAAAAALPPVTQSPAASPLAATARSLASAWAGGLAGGAETISAEFAVGSLQASPLTPLTGILGDASHLARSTPGLRFSSSSLVGTSLSSENLKAELCRSCERLEAEFAAGLSENRSLAEANEQLRVTLSARRKRLEEVEIDAEQQEAAARSHLEELQKKNREEWQHVEALRGLVARAQADADAVEAARLVERQRSDEAISLRNSLDQQRVVLEALRGQLEEHRHASSGQKVAASDAEADRSLERGFATKVMGDLRSELRVARQALEAQEVRGEQVSERSQALEDELHLLRSQTRSSPGESLAASAVLGEQLRELSGAANLMNSLGH